MGSATAETVLQVEQSVGEPIDVSPDELKTYERIVKKTAGKRQGGVPEYMTAAAVDLTRSYDMPRDDLISIVRSWAQIGPIIEAETGGAPVIHDGTTGKAIGLTDPEQSTVWFKHSTILGHRPDQLMIPTAKEVSLRHQPEHREWGDEYAEGVDLESFRPFRVLTSGDPKDVKHFREYNAEWMRYPGSKLVVGTEAVAANLRAQADAEMNKKTPPYWGDRVRFNTGREGFSNSSLLYDVSALKTLGYEVNLGEERERAMHSAGVDVVAGFIVAGFNEGYGDVLHEGEIEKILRRLPAANVGMEHVEEVSKRASQLIGAKSADPTNAFVAHAQHQGDIDTYLVETTANFMRHVLGVEEKL